jgi:hypothetical protein
MRKRFEPLWIVVIVGFVLIHPLSEWVYKLRMEHNLLPATPVTKIVAFSPTEVTGVVAGAVLGGFRGPAATLLWIKVDEMWNRGEGTQAKTLNVMRTVTLLDPRWLRPWIITSWHMAYNLDCETDDPDQKAWLKRQAIACLKEGISWNADKYDLYWELGWTHFDRYNEFEEAVKWLGICTRYEHPEYIDRLIAHAYERHPDIEKALDWYEFCLKRDPRDHVALGATLTIRERYLRAWRLLEQERYDEAIEEIDRHLAVEPLDTIGLHVRATIYEEAGDLEHAYQAWRNASTRSAVNKRAVFKTRELMRKLGRFTEAQIAEITPTFEHDIDTGYTPLGPPGVEERARGATAGG